MNTITPAVRLSLRDLFTVPIHPPSQNSCSLSKKSQHYKKKYEVWKEKRAGRGGDCASEKIRHPFISRSSFTVTLSFSGHSIMWLRSSKKDSAVFFFKLWILRPIHYTLLLCFRCLNKKEAIDLDIAILWDTRNDKHTAILCTASLFIVSWLEWSTYLTSQPCLFQVFGNSKFHRFMNTASYPSALRCEFYESCEFMVKPTYGNWHEQTYMTSCSG